MDISNNVEKKQHSIYENDVKFDINHNKYLNLNDDHNIIDLN